MEPLKVLLSHPWILILVVVAVWATWIIVLAHMKDDKDRTSARSAGYGSRSDAPASNEDPFRAARRAGLSLRRLPGLPDTGTSLATAPQAINSSTITGDVRMVGNVGRDYEERMPGSVPGPWKVVGGKDGEDAHRSS